MSAVRARGNKTTEWVLRSALMREGISGWTLHAADLPGRPDFVFSKRRVVVFLDGCFWHSCRTCRLVPRTNRLYWGPKLKRNRDRDRAATVALRRRGFVVLRFWEHQMVASVTSVLQSIKRVA